MIDMGTMAVSWLQLAGTKQHMDCSLNGLRSESHMSTNIHISTVFKLMGAHAAGHCNIDKFTTVVVTLAVIVSAAFPH